MENRRFYARIAVYLDVYWEGLEGRHKGTISDISQGGCYILTDGEASHGELIRVEIKSPTGQWVMLWGEVTYCEDLIGIGVKFTELDESERQQIKQTLQLLLAQKKLVATLQELSNATQRSLSLDRYNDLIHANLHKVGDTLAALPDGELKDIFTSVLEPFTDAAQVWKGATTDGSEGNQMQLALHEQLARKYSDIPAADLDRLLSADPVPVITFLWEQGRTRLNYAS